MWFLLLLLLLWVLDCDLWASIILCQRTGLQHDAYSAEFGRKFDELRPAKTRAVKYKWRPPSCCPRAGGSCQPTDRPTASYGWRYGGFLLVRVWESLHETSLTDLMIKMIFHTKISYRSILFRTDYVKGNVRLSLELWKSSLTSVCHTAVFVMRCCALFGLNVHRTSSRHAVIQELRSSSVTLRAFRDPQVSMT